MRARPTALLLASALLLGVGCTSGTIALRPYDDAGVGPSGEADAAAPSAAATFEASVEGTLTRRCAGCHSSVTLEGGALDFLRPNPDVRSQLFEYEGIVDLVQPSSSRLLTHGAHAGPALMPDESTAVRRWIALEVDERGTMPPEMPDLNTAPIVVGDGPNVLTLDRIGLTGAQVLFDATRLVGGLLIENLRVVAGPAGVRLRGPTLVVWVDRTPTDAPLPEGPELRIAPDGTAPLGAGGASLTTFPEGAGLAMRFTVARPLHVAAAPAP